MTERTAIVYSNSEKRAIKVVADFTNPDVAALMAERFMPAEAHAWTLVPVTTVFQEEAAAHA